MFNGGLSTDTTLHLLLNLAAKFRVVVTKDTRGGGGGGESTKTIDFQKKKHKWKVKSSQSSVSENSQVKNSKAAVTNQRSRKKQSI
jgi:hypothetical protein